MVSEEEQNLGPLSPLGAPLYFCLSTNSQTPAVIPAPERKQAALRMNLTKAGNDRGLQGTSSLEALAALCMAPYHPISLGCRKPRALSVSRYPQGLAQPSEDEDEVERHW